MKNLLVTEKLVGDCEKLLVTVTNLGDKLVSGFKSQLLLDAAGTKSLGAKIIMTIIIITKMIIFIITMIVMNEH